MSDRHERVHAVCPLDCPSACALEVERIDPDTVGRIYGAPDQAYTAGVICAKVAAYGERVHGPNRLTSPLRRIGPRGVGIDSFEPIGWDEALDTVADRFKAAADKHGPETVWPFFYAGTMGLVQRDGIERLRHVMKYSRQHSTYCSTLANAGFVAGAGIRRGVPAHEMSESDLVVIWGTNAVHTQVQVMRYVTMARRRGAPVVVVDPYRNATAAKADHHLMLRPGTDGALACAMMHVLFREGLADREYMARYTDVPDELERHLASRTPEWAAAITGLSVDEIVAFARLYGKTKKSYIRLGYGFTRSRNGAVNMHAVTCLPAVTGAWQHKGGGALYVHYDIYGIDKTLIEGLDRRDESVRRLDQSRIGAILCGHADVLQGGPPVTAMLIQNTNPVVVAPESGLVRRGFERDDLFVCVHEQVMTETAAMADIVLPATTFLEHDDMYLSGGHTFMQISPRVINPLADCRPNHDVICGLAKRLGARHEGFTLSTWEIIDRTLKSSGYEGADALAKKRWHDCAVDFEEAHFLSGFAHPDGRFRFRPDWASIGPDADRLPAFPDHAELIEAADAEHPFRMVTAPARFFLNTTFTETENSVRKEKRPTAMLAPGDCESLGIGAGDQVILGNARGEVHLHAEVTEAVKPGTVIVESVWPNAAFINGCGINTLVGSSPGLPDGGGAYHDTAVWIRAARAVR